MPTFINSRWREHARHWMALAHLLQHLNEEAYLYLCSLLQKGVQCCRAFSFAQHLEPLLDGAELVLEVLVEGGCCHLLQRVFVLINICYPLLSQRVGGIDLGIVLCSCLVTLSIEIRRWANATRRARS